MIYLDALSRLCEIVRSVFKSINRFAPVASSRRKQSSSDATTDGL